MSISLYSTEELKKPDRNSNNHIAQEAFNMKHFHAVAVYQYSNNPPDQLLS